ncbi:MAG: hypothetical protein ACTSP1_15515 [Candidatus Freyarchaeota archaeon]
MLKREVYRELERIVGPENITEEPAILDTYAYQWCAEVEKAIRGGRALKVRLQAGSRRASMLHE